MYSGIRTPECVGNPHQYDAAAHRKQTVRPRYPAIWPGRSLAIAQSLVEGPRWQVAPAARIRNLYAAVDGPGNAAEAILNVTARSANDRNAVPSSVIAVRRSCRAASSAPGTASLIAWLIAWWLRPNLCAEAFSGLLGSVGAPPPPRQEER
jgi:hypothetical protein